MKMKNKNLISLFEYEKKSKRDENKNIKLENKDLEIIEKYYSKQFDILANNNIRAKQFCGVCQIRKTTIEVLPKIFSKNKNFENLEKEKELIFERLLFMLSTTKKLKITDTEISKLSKSKNSIFEIFIHLFSKNLLELLIKDYKKNYIQKEENLNFLKGKLNFIKNIKYNFVNKAKFYCEFEEFEENILMNQILKSCVRKLLRFTKSNENFNLLRKCDFIMGDVDFIKFQNPKVCDRVIFTRLNNEYKKVFELAKLLLFGESPKIHNDNFETFSFMFDMNKLFEEFIFEILKENKSGLGFFNIQSENPRLNIFNEEDEKKRNSFQLKPDILINVKEIGKEKTAQIILDTKYKKISKEEKNYGVSQRDIYQIFTYSKYYKSEKNILLYPKYRENINTNLKNTYLNFDLNVMAIDLSLVDSLSLNEYKEEIRKQLKKISDNL